MKYRLKGNRKIQQHNNNNRSTKSWFFEKNKADRVSARLKLTKKIEDSSSEKKEMFPDTVDRQRLIKSTKNNHSPTSWIIQKKRIHSQKHTTCQDWILKKQKSEQTNDRQGD